MLREFLVALFFVAIQYTTQHFIGNLDECILSKTCNHTWTPSCGFNENDSNYRLFLDDCDMHEYNCDNNKSYEEVLIQECNGRCTHKDSNHQMPSTPALTPEEPKTTETPKPAEVTTTITISKTSLEVTETTTDKSDPSTIFVAETSEVIAENKERTEEDTTTTSSVPDTTTDTSSTSTITSSTATTSSPVTNETPQTSPSTSTSSTPTVGLRCPGNCSLPTTWETTSIGETRDFVQILRRRFGDRVKIMRDTTHFPKYTTRFYNYRRRGIFMPNRHRGRLRFG